MQEERYKKLLRIALFKTIRLQLILLYAKLPPYCNNFDLFKKRTRAIIEMSDEEFEKEDDFKLIIDKLLEYTKLQ